MMRIAAITCAVALAAFGAFAAEPGQAQPAPVDVRASQGSVSVRLTAPTSRIEAGQPLAMELTIEATQGDAFEVPRIGAALGSFDVLSSSRQTGQSDGVRRATLRFTVLTLDSGEVTLPAIPVAITREDGSRGTVDAGPVTLTVSSLMGGQFDPAALRDIKGPVTIDVGWAWWWLVAACAAGAMALLAALSLWRNRALRLAAPVPAHEWALAELESLERDALPESGQTHSFWVRLSDIVRQYVERRFELRAPERTTPEFLAEARSHAALSEDHRMLLAQFLRMADMVKFAGVRPAVGDCRSALDTARILVRQTVPAGSAPDAPASAPASLEDAVSEGGRR